MSYQPISVDQMRDSLLTLDQIRTKIAPTENLSEFDFEAMPGEVTFDYPDGWQDGIRDKKVDGLTPTAVTVSLANGLTKNLTKDAALEAGATMGVTKALNLSTPGSLITELVNHHYSTRGTKHKLLAGENGVGFTRGSVHPFSNERLLDAIVEGVQARYGTDEILGDYKTRHDLERTNLRLIIPAASREIMSARTGSTSPDIWSLGFDVNNSIIGKSSLELAGYGFSWWCTNGCTTTHVSSGKYRRKPTADVNDAYIWAREVIDEVLGGLEHELDEVQKLTEISLESNLNDTLGPLFNDFGVPDSTREGILLNLAESGDLTAYGLLNSITAAANDEDLSPSVINSLVRAGGRVVGTMGDRCELCHK